VPDIQGALLVSAIQVKAMHAYPDDPTFELSLLAEYASAIQCRDIVEVPKSNRNKISCSNGSFLECSPPFQVSSYGKNIKL
jgi:hypothetical protein